MKTKLSLLVFFLLSVTLVFGKQGKSRQKIHEAKMAYIAHQLDLSATQSDNFMPIYKDYDSDLRNIRIRYIKKYKLQNGEDSENMSARQYVEEDLDYQQEVIELKRSYNDRFLKVITRRQLSELYVAEREFRQVLIRRLEQRRKGNGGR